MRMREPPESHKQRLYKLPQVSWSWEATLIVYWGDFSLEGYYLHLRNSYTFKSSLQEISLFFSQFICFLVADSPFFKFTTCGCETCCGCVLSHHLSSTWRACYSLFWLVANGVRCIFKLISGYPAFLCPIGKILFSPVCKCVCGLKFWVSKSIPIHTFSRTCWSMHRLRYVNFNEHIIWRFSWKEGGRGYLSE